MVHNVQCTPNIILCLTLTNKTCLILINSVRQEFFHFSSNNWCEQSSQRLISIMVFMNLYLPSLGIIDITASFQDGRVAAFFQTQLKVWTDIGKFLSECSIPLPSESYRCGHYKCASKEIGSYDFMWYRGIPHIMRAHETQNQ